jgi:hypothetical protein
MRKSIRSRPYSQLRKTFFTVSPQIEMKVHGMRGIGPCSGEVYLQPEVRQAISIRRSESRLLAKSNISIRLLVKVMPSMSIVLPKAVSLILAGESPFLLPR